MHIATTAFRSTYVAAVPGTQPPMNAAERLDVADRIEDAYMNHLVRPAFEFVSSFKEGSGTTVADITRGMDIAAFDAEVGAALALGATAAPELALRHAVAVAGLAQIKAEFADIQADTTVLTDRSVDTLGFEVQNFGHETLWYYQRLVRDSAR